MPIHPIKRLEDNVRDLVQIGDYVLYLLINFFKFKPIPRDIRRILVVELLNIGDIIVITPTLRALRQHYPFAEIDVLLKKDKQEVLANHPSITNVIPYISFFQTLSTLRQRKYDLALLLHPGSLKISTLLLKAGIKYRVGGTKTGITYGKGFFLHKKAFPNNKWQHKIDDNLDIIRFINIHPTTRRLELSLNPQVEKNIKTLLSKKKKPLIGMNVASQHPSQRWHPERFAQVANELIKKYKATIVFTGIEKERDQIQAVINHIPNKQSILDLTGKTNFEELKAVIKHLDVLITIDSSSTHIASAFDTPVLTLFGSTIPTFWGPTGKHSSYIWKNKEANVGWRREYLIVGKDDSMEKISTQEVLEQAKKLLKN